MRLLKHALRAVLMIALIVPHLARSEPHLEIDVSIVPETRALSATASITTEALDLTFYLAGQFVLESVAVDGATFPTDRTIVDELQRFRIDLPDAGKPQRISVKYHGTLQPLDTTMSHGETLEALPAMSSPQGSYLPGNSSWHPMLEAPFTYRLNTRLPEGHIAVAPGAPSDEVARDGIRYASFSMNRPVESIDMMVGRWTIRERVAKVGEAKVRLRAYFDEAELPLADGYLDAAQRFIERYSQEIGAYPYSEFSVVASPIPTGFGMPTLTYLGKAVLAYPFIRDISLGHEVLHNWWGNGVRVDAVRGNWAEGLTTFMADYAYREDESAQTARRMRHGWLRDYAALPATREQALSSFRARHHTASAAIGYGKAAMMFYALRARLGADAFDRGIRIFWNRHRYDTASFDDLRQAFEQAADQSLVDFFHQWLERTGAPRIQITEARMAEGERAELALELAQGAPPFELSVPLRLFHDDSHTDVRVKLSAASRKVRIPTQAAVTAIEIDPGFEVWRHLAAQEMPPILRDVIAAEHVLVVALDESLREGAMAFSQALSEGKATFIKPQQGAKAQAPLIVVGRRDAIATYLKQFGNQQRPSSIDPGVVAAWMVMHPDQKILVVAIEAAAQAKTNLLQFGTRLRHFGSYSWVSVAQGGKTTRGNWPVDNPRINVPK